MVDYIIYKRVSTAKQGLSGLGLDAQARAVSDHLRPSDRIIAEFTEVESGKRSDRPQLALAIERAKLTGAKLLVAKLDRLARNLHFITTLMQTKVRFVAADMPDANDLTVHILAAVAEAEAKMISARTKAALAAAKAKGTRLGNDGSNLANAELGLLRSAAIRSARADDHASGVSRLIDQAKAEGSTSLRAVARWLNDRRIMAPRGGVWSASSVRRVIERVE
ncbi:recombinase family protein [Sphingomonas aerolata]|uniref:recombinase family protein n=1 Tax=Sphingomonas aerolata TaxID=185951 RepID=UPI002FDF6D0A